MRAKPGKRIGRALELDGQIAIFLLHLVVGHRFRTIIGNSSGGDNRVALGVTGAHGIEKVLRAHDVHELDAFWRLKRNGTAHEHHLRAAVARHLGDGIAHAARRVVGNKTHRVDGFLRRPRSYQNPLAFQIALAIYHIELPHSTLSNHCIINNEGRMRGPCCYSMSFKRPCFS